MKHFFCYILENVGLLLSIVSILLALYSFVVCLLRPKLKINTPEFETESKSEVRTKGKSRIKVKIVNKRFWSKAINVKVEMCVVDIDGNTYHLHIDKDDFLIIPRKDCRVFQSYDLSEIAKEYYDKGFDSFINDMIKNEKHKFRVRVHAAHSYSGFGRAKEKSFQYKAGKFIPWPT